MFGLKNMRAHLPCSWGFWENDASSTPVPAGKPFTLTITAEGGSVQTVTLSDWKSKELGVQFSG
jgi:hypothetical protein